MTVCEKGDKVQVNVLINCKSFDIDFYVLLISRSLY